MPRRFIKTMTIVSGLLACRSAASGQTAPELAVLTGTQLAPGYVLTVNSSENMTGWVTPEGNSALRMQYPAGQRFGAALFSVVGSNRPEVDLSFYQTLIVEISGERAPAMAPTPACSTAMLSRFYRHHPGSMLRSAPRA
jgi:hypothetical protein